MNYSLEELKRIGKYEISIECCLAYGPIFVSGLGPVDYGLGEQNEKCFPDLLRDPKVEKLAIEIWNLFIGSFDTKEQMPYPMDQEKAKANKTLLTEKIAKLKSLLDRLNDGKCIIKDNLTNMIAKNWPS